MNKEFQMKLLSLIERDSKLSADELAQMLNCDAATVEAALAELENEQVICGYHTLINWDKVDPDSWSSCASPLRAATATIKSPK